MKSNLNPYISFKGKARQAMEFYQGVFGGDLTMNTFGEFGVQGPPSDGIMHAALNVDGQPLLMGSDALDDEPRGFALALGGSDSEELHGLFDKLAQGGTIAKEISKEAWGDEYGEVVDQFGVRWMFNIAASK